MSVHLELSGKTQRHVRYVPELEVKIHHQVVTPLLQLKEESRRHGFDLCIASGFRSYQRQETIWNNKTSGKTPLLDENGRLLETRSLSSLQLIQTICYWSALPGTSRHHWGSDVDVYDKNALPANYKLQMIPQEVEKGGPFAPFHDWLDDYMNRSNDFFRPYDGDSCDVSPERWHLSYHPVASTYQQYLTLDFFDNLIDEACFNLKETVSIHKKELFRRFIYKGSDRRPSSNQKEE